MSRIDWNNRQITLTAQAVAVPKVRLTTAQVLTGAKVLAPKGSHLSGSGKRRPGQPLNASLKSRMSVSSDTVLGVVWSDKEYAATVHQGSRPHTIYRRGRKLTFRWARGDASPRLRARRLPSGMFVFSKVRHPGNKRAVRYLATPLHQFGSANGFRVSSSAPSRFFLP